MGKRWIIEEVEDKPIGCGSIIAIAVILLIIGLFGGFKSGEDENKSPASSEVTIEEVESSKPTEIESPINTSSPSEVQSTATSSNATGYTAPRDKQPSTNPVADQPSRAVETTNPASDTEEIATESTEEPQSPILTEKEQRKAERQAKREARRREKAQKND